MKPFFSVIIPAYNRGHVVGKAIESVLDQSYKDFELIVVDDGSTDDTRSVVRGYADNRIRYMYQKNAGVSSARNLGARNASGEFLAFLDSDDRADTSWLENFNKSASSEGSDIIFCDMVHVIAESSVETRLYGRDPYGDQRGGLRFLAGGFVVRKELFRCIGGYDIKLKYAENTDLGWRLLALKPAVSYTDQVGLYYQVTKSGAGQNAGNKIEAVLYLLERHATFFKKESRIKRLFLQNAGVAAARLGQFSQARELFIKAWIAQPWKLTTILRYSITLMPLMSTKVWGRYEEKAT